MMKTRLFFRSNKHEITALIINVILFIGANFFTDLLRASIITIFVLVISTILIIYWRTKDKDFYFLPLDRPGQDRDWIGRGDFDFVENEKCHEITNSHVGFIFPKTINWDNYNYQFRFKIVNKYLGWIVRAIDLSNYVMLQCDYTGINPHIRLDGQWIRFEQDDVNLKFKKPLCPDTWYKAKIICEKRSIRILISKNRETIFDRHWKIESGLVVTFKDKERGGEDINIFRDIDFDFGAVGFRNHGEERGFVKDVLVERF